MYRAPSFGFGQATEVEAVGARLSFIPWGLDRRCVGTGCVPPGCVLWLVGRELVAASDDDRA